MSYNNGFNTNLNRYLLWQSGEQNSKHRAVLLHYTVKRWYSAQHPSDFKNVLKRQVSQHWNLQGIAGWPTRSLQRVSFLCYIVPSFQKEGGWLVGFWVTVQLLRSRMPAALKAWGTCSLIWTMVIFSSHKYIQQGPIVVTRWRFQSEQSKHHF